MSEREVIFSVTAEEDFGKVIGYLRQKWTEVTVQKFIRQFRSVVSYIGKNPLVFEQTSIPGIRRAVVTKHNSIIYTFNDSEIYIVRVFDTRLDPQKMLKKHD